MNLTGKEIDAARIVDAMSTLIMLSDMVGDEVFETAMNYVLSKRFGSDVEEEAAVHKIVEALQTYRKDYRST